MAYRDFEGALLEERRVIVEEIERIDTERARFRSNLRRRDELTERLRQLESRLVSPEPEPSPILAELRLASPCSARWDDMIGDDRIRFCPSCAKNVYDLSNLSGDEVRELVMQTEGQFCGRLRKRQDDRVLTDDCPVGLRRKRRLRLAVAAVAAAGAAGGVSLQATETQPSRSLLLVVKYVDRVGTEVEQRIEPLPRSEPKAYRHEHIMGGMRRVDRGKGARRFRAPR